MNRSAAWSSSAVVTPGRHFEISIFRQRAWMRPAAAICSICSGVLRMMPPRYISRASFRGSASQPAENRRSGPSTHARRRLGRRRSEACCRGRSHGWVYASSSMRRVARIARILPADLVGGLRAVDALEHAAVLVIGDERLGLVVVGLEPLADDLGLVVVADDQLAAADVADALLLGRVELDVEDVAVLGAGAPAAEPPDDLLVRDVDQEHRGERSPELGDPGVECLRLRRRAREAVEDEPVGRLGLRRAARRSRRR